MNAERVGIAAPKVLMLGLRTTSSVQIRIALVAFQFESQARVMTMREEIRECRRIFGADEIQIYVDDTVVMTVTESGIDLRNERKYVSFEDGELGVELHTVEGDDDEM